MYNRKWAKSHDPLKDTCIISHGQKLCIECGIIYAFKFDTSFTTSTKIFCKNNIPLLYVKIL